MSRCTGAKLPSDGFSMLDPLEDIETRCELLLEVAGFRYASDLALSEINASDPVQFVEEPRNQHDTQAAAVHLRGLKIGYMPRQQAPAVATLLRNEAIEAVVERVNGSADRPLVYLFTRIQPLAASAVAPHRWAQ